MTRALLSVGSNLEPRRHVPAALHALRRHRDIEVLATSDVFASDPVGGPPGSPRFLNAAIEIETQLGAPALRRDLFHLAELDIRVAHQIRPLAPESSR